MTESEVLADAPTADYDGQPNGLSAETKILIAEVVLSASQAEYSAGLLLQTIHDLAGDKGTAKGWGLSGERLLELLKPHIPAELHRNYSGVLQFRNALIHGLVISGEAMKGKEGAGKFYVMKPDRKGVGISGLDPFILNHSEMATIVKVFEYIDEELSRLDRELYDARSELHPNPSGPSDRVSE